MRGYNNPDETGECLFRRLCHFLTANSDMSLSGNIPVPVLVIVGDRDPVALASNQLSQTLPYGSDVRIRTIDAGHYLQLEAPQETNRHLHLFLRDVMGSLDRAAGL